MKQKLLYITHHKLDDNNGGCNASKGFLHCFASLFDEGAVICHTMDNPSSYIPSNFTYYPMQDKRSKARKLFDMYRGAISGHYYFVRQHLKEHHYDVVVIDHTFTGAGLSKFIKSTGARLITIHHNVERDYLRDNGKERPLLYRYPFLYYCRKSERDCLQNSDINLTVTERDASIFRSWYPDIQVSNWGIFEYRPIEDKVFPSKPKGQTFIITGSLNFGQSLVPIIDFVQNYWPLIRRSYPQAQLLIAGRNPSQTLSEACTATVGITIIPNPEDTSVVVRKADYYICPIHAGSGLKLRIFDGLKQGLPILCHDVAAAGYEPLAANGFLYTYNDTHSFQNALCRMVEADFTPQKIYQAFKNTFSLGKGQEKLEIILKQEHII